MDKILETYFTTTDQNERKKIFDILREEPETDQETVRIISYLWKLRYDRKINRTVIKDAFLDSLMQLLAIDNMRKSGIGWKNLQKQVFQISEILGLEDDMFQTEKGAELFCREYENLAMYFVELGKDDRAYGKGILRINRLEEDDFVKKIERDFHIISEEVPKEFGFSNMFIPLKNGMDSCILKMK